MLQSARYYITIDDCEVVVIGDRANDIEMLHQACHSFAMANAIASVKTLARYKNRKKQ